CSTCSDAPPPVHSVPTRRSSDLPQRGELLHGQLELRQPDLHRHVRLPQRRVDGLTVRLPLAFAAARPVDPLRPRRREELLQHTEDRKSTRLNSSHVKTSYAVFCL